VPEVVVPLRKPLSIRPGRLELSQFQPLPAEVLDERAGARIRE